MNGFTITAIVMAGFMVFWVLWWILATMSQVEALDARNMTEADAMEYSATFAFRAFFVCMALAVVFFVIGAVV